eukprot:Hpha_TRINITY_DN16520_c0_g3::TRINITY_DN16520_c0_g3_i2::g.132754::m.132754
MEGHSGGGSQLDWSPTRLRDDEQGGSPTFGSPQNGQSAHLAPSGRTSSPPRSWVLENSCEVRLTTKRSAPSGSLNQDEPSDLLAPLRKSQSNPASRRGSRRQSTATCPQDRPWTLEEATGCDSPVMERVESVSLRTRRHSQPRLRLGTPRGRVTRSATRSASGSAGHAGAVLSEDSSVRRNEPRGGGPTRLRLAPDEVRKLRLLWDKIDADRTGVLDRSKALKALRAHAEFRSLFQLARRGDAPHQRWAESCVHVLSSCGEGTLAGPDWACFLAFAEQQAANELSRQLDSQSAGPSAKSLAFSMIRGKTPKASVRVATAARDHESSLTLTAVQWGGCSASVGGAALPSGVLVCGLCCDPIRNTLTLAGPGLGEGGCCLRLAAGVREQEGQLRRLAGVLNACGVPHNLTEVGNGSAAVEALHQAHDGPEWWERDLPECVLSTEELKKCASRYAELRADAQAGVRGGAFEAYRRELFAAGVAVEGGHESERWRAQDGRSGIIPYVTPP